MTSTLHERAAVPRRMARTRKVLRLLAIALLISFGCLAIEACARPVIAWADDADIVNYGNPFENGDFTRELHVDDQYFGYKMAGVTVNVGGIHEAGVGPAPYAYPQVLVDYANAMREAGRSTGYGDWGVSDFHLDDVEVAQNSRGLKFSALPTQSHCCQHDNETTYNYPRTAYLLLIDELSWWSDEGSVFHGVFALMTRNLGASMGIWDQGTAGSSLVYADWVVQGSLEIDKQSLAPGFTEGNPLYELGGATFSIYDADGTLVDTLTTDGDGHASKDGLAPGAYTLVELEAPAGYATSEQSWPFEITSDQTTYLTISDAPLHNPLEVWAFKADSLLGGQAQGGATLADAEFTIDYYAGFYDADDLPASPTRSWTVATDASGKADVTDATLVAGDELYHAPDGSVALPRGTVRVRETKAPTGYLLQDAHGNALEPVVMIVDGAPSADGVLTAYNAPTFTDEVVRGDFAFDKVDGETMERMALVPFCVTSQTTGEQHVIVTDENGMFSSAASWNVHSANTNANDHALDEAGIIDANGLDPQTGTWFAGHADIDVDVDDALGALPFDTYLVEELPATSNAGHGLISFMVAITRNARELDLGTIDDDVVDVAEPTIATTAHDVERGGHEGVLGGTVGIVDEVVYTNLEPGTEYLVKGILMDRETGKPLIVDGQPIEAYVPFVAEQADGTVEVVFSFDGSELGEVTLVAFEQLLVDGAVIAEHADIDSAPQTVTYREPTSEPEPSIATTAHDAASESHEGTLGSSIRIVDEVVYEYLRPGVEYRLEGTLVDKTTGKPFETAGQTVTATTSFVPTEASGLIDMTFEFDGSALNDATLVVFETLFCGDDVVAEHADLESSAQTVSYRAPEPKTALPRTGDELKALPYFAIAATCAAASVAIALMKSTRPRRRHRR